MPDWLSIIGQPAVGQGGAPLATLDLAAKSLDFSPAYQVHGLGAIQSYQYEYDFTVDGGAVATYNLRQPGQIAGQVGLPLPPGFVVMEGILDVLTAFTTGAAGQGAVSTGQGAGDLVAAAVVSGAPYSTLGIKATVPVFTAATAIKATAQRTPTFIITVGAITAGKFRLLLIGYQSALT